MTHEDQVLVLFGTANPVPDPDAFTGIVEGSRSPHETRSREQTDARNEDTEHETNEPTNTEPMANRSRSRGDRGTRRRNAHIHSR